MKLRMRYFTTSLTFFVILLVGCSGCAQKTMQETELTEQTTSQPKTIIEYQIAAGLPAELTPRENPYQGITINNEAPSFTIYNNPVYWIPELEYKTVWSGIYNHRDNYYSSPDIPDYDVNVFNTRIAELEKERGEPVPEKERMYIGAKMKYGHLTPLNAAKAMLPGSIHTNQYLSDVVQQALDANPNDFHTLLIWTEAQPYQSETQKEGYRRLHQMRPNNPYVSLRYGLTIRYDNRQKSIELFKKAVQYAPAERYGSGRSGIHVRDWALQALAKAYFAEGEKQKSKATFQYLQQITTADNTRERATEYIKDIEEGYKFGYILLHPTENKGETTNE